MNGTCHLAPEKRNTRAWWGLRQTENCLKGAALSAPADCRHTGMWVWSCQIYPEKPESLGRGKHIAFFGKFQKTNRKKETKHVWGQMQVDQTSPFERKSVLNIHWKDWCWSWSSNTLATWCEELTHWKRPWCWARLKAGGEGDDRGWDGWMASLTGWTWVWASSGSWWWTGKPGVLQSMGSAKSWTQLSDWTELNCSS